MDFSLNIFSRNASAPEKVKARFREFFPRARGIEWSVQNGGYEAVFTEDGVEKISLLDKDGALLEFRINLAIDRIPEEISRAAGSIGEIMNCISIANQDNLRYELIVRDSEKVRYTLYLDKEGNVIDQKKL